MKPIIVGVDPGTYVGVAVFDLNSNLISSSTITNPGKEAIVAEISKHGNPIVIASDVSPPPSFVTQIASYFNAKLYYPKSVISDLDKTLETSKFKFSSVHERDAIMAVLSFFKENSNKLRWIERTLRDKGLSNIEEDVKRYALSGMRVDDAIKALVPADDEYKKVIEYAKSLPEAPKIIKSQERREDRDTILGLLESNIRLRARVSVLEEELRELKSTGNKPDKEIKSLLFSKDMKIRRMKRILNLKDQKIRQLYKIIDSLRKEKEQKNQSTLSNPPAQQTQSQPSIQKSEQGRESNQQIKNEGKQQESETDSPNIGSLENLINEYRKSRFK